MFHHNIKGRPNIAWTDEQLDRMLEMRKAGDTYRKIGAEFNRNASTVRSALYLHRSEEMLALKKVPEGYITVLEYTKKYNVSKEAMYDLVHRGSIASYTFDNTLYIIDEKYISKKPPRVTMEEIEEWCDLREDGMKVKNIAKKYNRSIATVSRYLNVI